MDMIGWLSSGILAITILYQVYRQWREGHSEGVSVWLFVGQCIANIGFIVYSLSKPDWVFVFTNALLLATNLTGYVLTLRQHRKQQSQQAEQPGQPNSQSAQPSAPLTS